MMDQLVAEFPAQLKEAMEIGAKAQIKPHTKAIYKAHVAGMGGSAIGADFVAAFISDECGIPYSRSKGYGIPAYIDENTLAICSSYSGNTEETLAAFEAMLQTGAKVVCIASGGKLIEAAKANGLDYIELPGGSPSPRACLGYSLVQQLWILHHLGLIGDEKLKQVSSVADMLVSSQESIQDKARRIAPLLVDKIPVIYCEDRMEPVAVRLRQQINENSKQLAWHHVIPEMNHNELVGWRQNYPNVAVLVLRNEDDHARNQVRTAITSEIISEFAGAVITLQSKGANLLERSLYLVHLSDWISVYLAAERSMDAIEIKVIDYLKGELGKL